MSKDSKYIPALRFNILTPLFDPLLRWGMHEFTFKRRLIDEAHILRGYRVLDLGAGTGTLTVLLKQAHPNAEIIGIDGDPAVLSIARAKAAQQNVKITFDEGMAYQLPYENQSFDRVVSSLVFHHLTTEDKQRTLNEVYRILKPSGELLIVDFGEPQNLYARIIATLFGRLERTDDLTRGCLPKMFRRAGFQNVEIVTRFSTMVGTLALYRGRKP
ncbi:MAG: methyltransferase domain-containing protein [Chloroflexi bacterium]|nr:methyltransferase domain-containing protein [Chloroflexota bacterium]